MTDRDRLVELLKDTLHEWECDVSIKTVTEIAEHLISNGVIVLPCKVGDTLYCESAIKGHITYLKAPDLEWIFENREIFGKEIFLTREGAERALRERENNVTC